MQRGVMHLTDEAMAALREATIADTLLWADCADQEGIAEGKATPLVAKEILCNIGSPTCPVLLALHPFGRYTGGDITDARNWKVVGYEILARSVGGGHNFCFALYALFTGDERWQWTMECVMLSAKLNENGVAAKFSDPDALYAILARLMAPPYNVKSLQTFMCDGVAAKFDDPDRLFTAVDQLRESLGHTATCVISGNNAFVSRLYNDGFIDSAIAWPA